MKLQKMNVKLLNLKVLNCSYVYSRLLDLQFSNSRNYSLSLLSIWTTVVHCILSMTAQTAVKLQWENGHSGNLQFLQWKGLQCSSNRRFRIIWKNCNGAMSPGIPKVHNQANPMLKNSKNVVIPSIDKEMLAQQENLDVLCIIKQRA